VIGGINHDSMYAAKEVYKQFVKGELYLTDATTAEMVKLVENSLRDVQIAFAHQVAAMADCAGLDPYEVIELANKHPRVNILQPTAGVGGHCIAIDPWFLVETFKEQSHLIKAAREVNDARPHYLITKINNAITQWQTKYNKRPVIALMGATYKANVDDVRESPALEIIHTLVAENNADVIVCEPYLNKQTLVKLVGDRFTNITESVERADIVIFLVKHRQFKAIDQKILSQKIVLDCCGLWHKEIQKTDKQEYLFWPARSILDIFISNQEPTSEHTP
jgi:UDP-N-acetyl-D-mannosaminuronic acid dehydrogenase